MQQMNSEEMRGYEGYPHYNEEYASAFEQKLNADDADERFAELLAQKLRHELKGELQLAKPSIGPRLALAIVSLGMLVVEFGLLILALSSGAVKGGAEIGLAWGFLAVCGVTVAVNNYFNHYNSPHKSSSCNNQTSNKLSQERFAELDACLREGERAEIDRLLQTGRKIEALPHKDWRNIAGGEGCCE